MNIFLLGSYWMVEIIFIYKILFVNSVSCKFIYCEISSLFLLNYFSKSCYRRKFEEVYINCNLLAW